MSIWGRYQPQARNSLNFLYQPQPGAQTSYGRAPFDFTGMRAKVVGDSFTRKPFDWEGERARNTAGMFNRTPFDWSGRRAMNSPSYAGAYGTNPNVGVPNNIFSYLNPNQNNPSGMPGGNAILAPGAGPANPAMNAYSAWVIANPNASIEDFYKLNPQYKGGTIAPAPSGGSTPPWMY